jgi:hypothetical protein
MYAMWLTDIGVQPVSEPPSSGAAAEDLPLRLICRAFVQQQDCAGENGREGPPCGIGALDVHHLHADF